ncbi:MAG: hypothetical protein AB1585_21225 [Thermodesulfobacteriota bacterium]
MGPKTLSSVLISPFTLPEEEVLSWSVILFGQTILLHPYPLPLPASCLEAKTRNWIQVRTQNRSREEIRKKDTLLAQWEQSLSNLPGVDFLKYLAATSSLEKTETQDEITGLLRGNRDENRHSEEPALTGPILLCWIHQWMMGLWEMETSLAEIEEREKLMTLSWRENLEEGTEENPSPLMPRPKESTEIFLPAVLEAWREMKKELVPEALPLLTDQTWVWKAHYGFPPEPDRVRTLPLPSLNTLSEVALQNHSLVLSLREKMKNILFPPERVDQARLLEDFQAALSRLGLPENGQYRLTLPPPVVSGNNVSIPAINKEAAPLILLSISGD